MKFYVSIAVFVWLICGLAGAWLLGQQRLDIGTIARGPITLVKAIEKPVRN
jgi:hypothetical protein